MARKLDKRQGGVFQGIGNWLLGTKPQTHEEAIISNVSNTQHGIVTSMTDWPSSQNNVRLDGDVYVDGQCCKTVGQYKAACAKKYGT